MPKFIEKIRRKTMTPEEHLKKPYTYCLVWDEESRTWTGTIKEFPGCITQQDRLLECLMGLRQAAKDWIAAAQNLGQEIPEPEVKP
jgi:predicted RNase H-like HicB family nuclease